MIVVADSVLSVSIETQRAMQCCRIDTKHSLKVVLGPTSRYLFLGSMLTPFFVHAACIVISNSLHRHQQQPASSSGLHRHQACIVIRPASSYLHSTTLVSPSGSTKRRVKAVTEGLPVAASTRATRFEGLYVWGASTVSSCQGTVPSTLAT